MNDELVMLGKEKTLIAEIYKFDGEIIIEYPNTGDVSVYELYGFLDCYLDTLKTQLVESLENEG